MADHGDTVYLFGVHSVLEKLKSSPSEVEEVCLAKGHRQGPLNTIEEEARRRGIRITVIDRSELTRRLKGESKHQGVLAKVFAHTYADFNSLLDRQSDQERYHWILVLDGVTDPRNFGSLLRTAEGTGVSDVIVPKDRSVGITPLVIKASAGAANHINAYRVTNLRRAVQELKARGYWVVGLDVEAKDYVFSKTYPKKLVVVVGSEGAGIRPLLRSECDFLVSIPMLGKVGSLNVVVSAGMFLYELVRQKVGA